MLEHGGGLRAAAERYGIPLSDWLDLSTGINPNGWPPPPIPATVWRRLPEPDDGLEAAAAAYYGVESLLPVAGSQAAIQALPLLRASGRVGVLNPTYAEHAHAWRRAGHRVEALPAEGLDATVDRLDTLVLVHPNNPTGVRFPLKSLLDWRERLAARGGWLVIDEAFMDATPVESVARHASLPGLVVLRSLGKFFGLAGARVGFVLAEPALLEGLRKQLGPWTVAGPSRWVAMQALADRVWQEETRLGLARSGKRLADLLKRQGLPVVGGTGLFQWAPLPDAEFWRDALARRGILVRRFADPLGLRFGLPDGEPAWRRLELALAGVRAERLR
ncbi:MAG: threonine-phosphate decarboxylase CobD [Candidatus Contendobacter sp.]|nr:threonine-phosphate decarboxylase CobD [Candidatus Contendobacter sp.]MDG4555981.1 threonine-phosphate decarboxylase CobD [Candidatus Contendobacter sp.]